MNEWVDDFIDNVSLAASTGRKLEWTDWEGNQVLISVKSNVVSLLRENRLRLLKIGKDIFKEFLWLLSKGKEFEALVKINETLDNSELLEQYKTDSIKLAEAAADIQADRDFWVGFGKQVGMKILLGALGALL